SIRGKPAVVFVPAADFGISETSRTARSSGAILMGSPLLRRAALSAALVAALAAVRCGGGKSTAPTPPPTPELPGSPPPGKPTPSPSQPQTFIGAGDIGWCGSAGTEQTARLVQAIPGQVFTTGDNAYMDGSLRNYMDCYDPSWGRFRDRTRPVPGN